MKNINKKRLIKNIALLSLAVVISSLLITYAVFKENSLKIYDRELLNSPFNNVTFIDKDGNQIDNTINLEFADSTLAPDLVNAIISIEDKRFYQHNGVDYIRIGGALIKNIKHGKIVQGGSTISQQIIKNTHLTNDKNLKRKINEYFLAKKLERDYTKKEIMDMYLNITYFGNETYGVANASRLFFDKHYTELTLSECATIAGILNSPRLYSPFFMPENSISRRNLILEQMKLDGKITDEQFESAKNAPLNTIKRNSECEIYTNNIYCRAVLTEARVQNLKTKNTKIQTAFNPQSQRYLCQAMQNSKYHMPNGGGIIPDMQGLIINNINGGVEAYYASIPTLFSVKRQPASTIKPILVYAPAIEKNAITPATQILDEEINYQGYSPKNHNGKFHGFVSSRYALSHSLNVPAVKIFDYAGIKYCKEIASRAGVYFHKNDNGYALSLGGFTEGLTLKEIANTYQTLANQGQYINAGLINKIEDQDGKTIYTRPMPPIEVVSAETAYLVTDMLKSSAKDGTAMRLANLPVPLAAKTGTAGNSSGNSDAYCLAYTPLHTLASWHGNIQSNIFNMSLDVNGGSYPTMQIRDVIKSVYKNQYLTDFKKPSGIIKVEIDKEELNNNHRIIAADSQSKETKIEYFKSNNPPKRRITQQIA